MNISFEHDLFVVGEYFQIHDPAGKRISSALWETFDALYAGKQTGRFRWVQLSKIEKERWWAIAKIYIQREFGFLDGCSADFSIAGVEVACEISRKFGEWPITPEARNQICMLITAIDNENPTWSLGLVRATLLRLKVRKNHVTETILNKTGLTAIHWLWRDAPLPPNTLLQIPNKTTNRILTMKSVDDRINELFRSAQGLIVSRTVVATVAQQDDYMKRVRTNGGARSALKPEGIIILGQYESHARIATQLDLPRPGQGDFVSTRVFPATGPGKSVAEIGGSFWRRAGESDPIVAAPDLPKI